MMKSGPVSSFAPVIAPGAKVLILGVMPGAESLRRVQYYAFKRNAFWRIMGDFFGFSPELPYGDRLALLKQNGVALWDNLARCRRAGSLDSAIREPEPNDVAGLLAGNPAVTSVLCNGAASYSCFTRYQLARLARPLRVVKLPSTSPAAATVPYAVKFAAYAEALRDAGIVG